MRRAWPVVVLLLLCVAGCRKPWVSLGYDQSAPVRAGHTYCWGTVRLAVAQYQPTAQAAVAKNLAAKGWQLVPSGGSATVFVLGDIQNGQQLVDFYTKLGNGWVAPAWGQQGRGPGWRKSAYGEVDSVALGNPGNKLVVDIFDSGSHELLARAVGENDFSNTQKKNGKLLEKTIHRMLHGLPKQ